MNLGVHFEHNILLLYVSSQLSYFILIWVELEMLSNRWMSSEKYVSGI